MDRLFEEDKADEIKKWAAETLQLSELSDEELEERLRQHLVLTAGDRYISVTDQVKIVQSVFHSIRGYGVLDTILLDDEITEIMINGHENIFVEKHGVLSKLDVRFESDEKLQDVIQRIVGKTGREVNRANPIVDTHLPDGSRVNVVLPPVSLAGPIMTIRKFPDKPMTVNRLIACGSLTQEAAGFLKKLVQAKYNIVISGGTGSGKTTFLNALSDYIPSEERIITIEDSAELKLHDKPNLVSLETRNANASGNGRITIRDLIRASLRMRPDRIVVGEVRGEEALDMLQAMNTGHDGSISTGHANSAEDMLSRLETMVLTGSAQLPLPAIRRQIASAVDVIVHLSRLRDHTRRTMEISEVMGMEEGRIILNPLFRFEESQGNNTGQVCGQLVRTENAFHNTMKLAQAGLSLVGS